jgi:hypothetical protein
MSIFDGFLRPADELDVCARFEQLIASSPASRAQLSFGAP